MNLEPVINSERFFLELPKAVKDKIEDKSGGRMFNISAVSAHAAKGSNAAGEITSRQVVVEFSIERAGNETFQTPFTVALFMMAGDALDLSQKLAEAVQQLDRSIARQQRSDLRVNR